MKTAGIRQHVCCLSSLSGEAAGSQNSCSPSGLCRVSLVTRGWLRLPGCSPQLSQGTFLLDHHSDDQRLQVVTVGRVPTDQPGADLGHSWTGPCLMPSSCMTFWGWPLGPRWWWEPVALRPLPHPQPHSWHPRPSAEAVISPVLQTQGHTARGRLAHPPSHPHCESFSRGPWVVVTVFPFYRQVN